MTRHIPSVGDQRTVGGHDGTVVKVTRMVSGHIVVQTSVWDAASRSDGEASLYTEVIGEVTMTTQTVLARDIRPGDTILAESPRYHGPTVTVTAVRRFQAFEWSTPFMVFDVTTPHATTTRLSGAPLDKPYLVERAS